MDPNVTLAEMLAALVEGGTADFMDRANELASWMEKGGFKPKKLDQIVDLLTVSEPELPGRYIGRLYIVVEAKDENEAADAISAAMSDNLKMGGAIEEWGYTKDRKGRYTYPTLIRHSVLMGIIDDEGGVDEDANLDMVWNETYPYPF